MTFAPPDADDPSDSQALAASTDTLKIADLLRKLSLSHNPADNLFHGEYQFEDIPGDGLFHVNWTIKPGAAGIILHGKLTGVLALECDRCLTPYTVDVDLDIDERYVFSSFTEDFGKEKELLADDFYETTDEEGVLDLKDIARQFLLMEVENHPLCGTADCRFTLL